MTEYLNREKYERQATGLARVVGQEVRVKWGCWPQTDGKIIWLPDTFEDPWVDDDLLEAAFDHEMAHILCDSDVDVMDDWIQTWGPKGDKHDMPNLFGVFTNTAESIFQTLEDVRVESIYGGKFFGARKRFHERLRPEILTVNTQTPAASLLTLRAGYGEYNSKNTYWDVSDEWNEDFAEELYRSIEDVRFDSLAKTVAVSEEVMRMVFPWYRKRVSQVLDGDKEGEKLRELAKSDEDNAEKRKEVRGRVEGRNIESEAKEASDADDHPKIFKSEPKSDAEIDDEVVDGDVSSKDISSGEGSTGNQDIGELDYDEIEKYDDHIYPVTPTGPKCADVDKSLVRAISNRLLTIHAENRTVNGPRGNQLDLERYVERRHQPFGVPDHYQYELPDPGFTVVVLVDLSWSMSGWQLNTARNVATTLHMALENAAAEGPNIDFRVVGYSGGEGKLAIVPCDNSSDTSRLDLLDDYNITPTYAAIEWANDELSGDGAMVILTDGIPTGMKEGEGSLSVGRAMRYTREAVDKVDVPIMTIGVRMTESDELRKIFPNVTNIEDADELSQQMRTFTETELERYLQGR